MNTSKDPITGICMRCHKSTQRIVLVGCVCRSCAVGSAYEDDDKASSRAGLAPFEKSSGEFRMKFSSQDPCGSEETEETEETEEIGETNEDQDQ